MSARAVIELPRTRQAPGIARRWLAESFGAELGAEEQDTAKLLATELVTNAVVHGRGRIEVHAALDHDRLLIRVIDEGPGFTTTDFHTTHRHGLWIVDAEASRWGIREGTAEIWFELQRSQTDSGGNVSGATPDAERPEPDGDTRPHIASQTKSLVPGAGSPRWRDRSVSGANGRRGRAETAALYRRVADTLERSADRAEQHAERDRRHGRHQSARVELDRARRAREAARGGRALSSRLTRT